MSHSVSPGLYDAWKVEPPCDREEGCPRGCPYFEECHGAAESFDEEEPDEDEPIDD